MVLFYVSIWLVFGLLWEGRSRTCGASLLMIFCTSVGSTLPLHSPEKVGRTILTYHAPPISTLQFKNVMVYLGCHRVSS